MTPDEKENAEKYGVCVVHGVPRQAYREIHIVNGRELYNSGIVCPQCAEEERRA